MAKFPSTGVNIPGFINSCNSPSPTGYEDSVGNPFFMGLTPGKVVTLGSNEVTQFAAAGTKLYDGSYQWVQLDSGATAANAVQGRAAYLLLDTGSGSQGVQPEEAYEVPSVTTADIANTLYGSTALANAFLCGVFLNPATLNGAANTPTPGNWCFIFAGAGRVNVDAGSVAKLTLGQAVFPDTGNTGTFESAADLPTTPGVTGICVEAAAEGSTGVAYYPEFINRIPF